MTKEELIILLKKYNENVAKLALRRRDKRYYEKVLKRKPEIETNVSSTCHINSDIRSKNKISDKVGNSVVEGFEKSEKEKIEARQKIEELKLEITELEDKVKEADIRLRSLHFKERKILTAYYVENRTAEDIAQHLYFELFSRTCTPRYIRDVIKESTEKILNL